MNNQKLRKFRLIDKEGYTSLSLFNRWYLIAFYDSKGYFEGIMEDGNLLSSDIYGEREYLINPQEFQFFEEIPFEEEDNITQATISQEEPLNNDNEAPSNEVSGTFSDEMLHCIKEDCHAVNGSLCFYKEGVVFLWNEDEYFIEGVDDYHKVINSIKVLSSMKK